MLRHAIELSPRCARAHFYLGKILQTEGSEGDALSCFQKAVEIKPNYLEPAREINVIKMRQARAKKPQKGGFWDKFKKR
jgi:cytochrome c-type biogenesis protein CcmH/NrfG